MEFILKSFSYFLLALLIVFAFSLYLCFFLRSPQSSNPTAATNVNEAL